MQITLAVDDIINQMKAEISNLYHQLMLEKMTSKKLADLLEAHEKQNEQAEVSDVPVSTPVRRLSAAVESLPVSEDQQRPASSP